MSRKFDIAVLGATGAVGQTVLDILAERQFPVGKLIPLASKKSVGNTVEFKNKPLLIQDAETFDFSTVQICFCAVDAELA